MLRERGRRGRAAPCAILRVCPQRRAALCQGPSAYRVGAARRPSGLFFAGVPSAEPPRGSPPAILLLGVFLARAASWIAAEGSVLSGLPSLLFAHRFSLPTAASRLSSERHSLSDVLSPSSLTDLLTALFPHRWQLARGSPCYL